MLGRGGGCTLSLIFESRPAGQVGVVMQRALDPGSREVIIAAQDDAEYYREITSHHVVESLSERLH